jgi:hypothetical protein
VKSSLNAYFVGLSFHLDLCRDSEKEQINHLLVSRPKTQSFLFNCLGPDVWKENEGNVLTWFNSVTELQPYNQGSKVDRCWRRVDDDNLSEVFQACIGACTHSTFFLRLPSIMILEPDTSQTPAWDFPRFLGGKSPKNHRFELVGRIFFGHSHFICRFSVPSSSSRRAVYQYDGIANRGYSQHLAGSIDSLLAGTTPSDLPLGYTTYAAIYRLEGGQEAQEQLYQSQINKAKKYLKLDFTNPKCPVPISNDYCTLTQDDRGLWSNPLSAKWNRSSEFQLCKSYNEMNSQGIYWHANSLNCYI